MMLEVGKPHLLPYRMLPESPPSTGEKGSNVDLTPDALKICRRLAGKYRVSHPLIIEIALQAFESHVEHTAVVQVPALEQAIVDLTGQVSTLIGQAEQIERLSIEQQAAELSG
jgi:hypothetical protein